VNIICVNGLRYRKDPDKYIVEFRELIDAIGGRKMSNNVYFFLRLLPENMRRDLYINEQNLSSMENLYKAVMRAQTFKTAESAYEKRITKDQRIWHGCGIKGHIIQFFCNNRYMDNNQPYNCQQTERQPVAFGNMAEEDD
jgi:hypothetical protein